MLHCVFFCFCVFFVIPLRYKIKYNTRMMVLLKRKLKDVLFLRFLSATALISDFNQMPVPVILELLLLNYENMHLICLDY